MLRVYGDIQSGNCYKVKLLMNMLNIEHEWIPVDILAGETEEEHFKLMNPNTRIPVLNLGDGKFLCESNAILYYLAKHTPYFPEELYQQALVLQWQFFEQYSHEPYIATARYINKYLGLPEDRKAEYLSKQEGGHKALSVMEDQLQHSSFLIGEIMTIADISLYAYTHVADEGGFDLSPYKGIQDWISLIEKQPGYLAMNA